MLTRRPRLLATPFCCLLFLSITSAASGQSVSFTMNQTFLRTMVEQETAQPTFRVRMNAHGPLHTLANDCEMHIGGTVQGMTMGNPPAVVVEFPNWCKFSPAGETGLTFNSLSAAWRSLMTTKVVNKTCEVTGFLRIFTEHASGGGTGGSNPDHVYEFHPALSMTCGSETFDFRNMLSAPQGLRRISKATAANCINGRALSVRFRNNRYEFSQEGGGSCGNFAIVEITSINLDWSFALGGGHYAFADVTADGSSTGGLGIYTMAGTPEDIWLAQAIGQGGLGNTTKRLHGVFTYDWQAIFDTLLDQQGNLRKPQQWERVDFPLAMVVYGETSTPF